MKTSHLHSHEKSEIKAILYSNQKMNKGGAGDG